MSTRFEWAHASDGPELIDPNELTEFADDGNPDGEWGLAWSTGSDGCMIFGSLEDMREMAYRIVKAVTDAQYERAQPEPLGPPNPAHADDDVFFTHEPLDRPTGPDPDDVHDPSDDVADEYEHRMAELDDALGRAGEIVRRMRGDRT